MKFKMTVNVWKSTRWMKGYRYANGYTRSLEHVKLMKLVGKAIRENKYVNYYEEGPWPNTLATVVITDGTKTRQHEAGAASKRTYAHVNDPVGTKRVRKNNVRSNSTRKKAAVDVGRQRKRKSFAS